MRIFQTDREQMQFLKGSVITMSIMLVIFIALAEHRGWGY
jgi:hypothetical protein